MVSLQVFDISTFETNLYIHNIHIPFQCIILYYLRKIVIRIQFRKNIINTIP